MSQAIPFSRTMEFEYGVPREVAPDVRRIVANNPSPFTFKGTNTYLVGRHKLAVLDPGPDDPGHHQAIMDAAGSNPITHIILTHTHRDHCDGLAKLKASTGATTYGFKTGNQARGTGKTSPPCDEFTDTSFVPDVPLNDGGQIDGDDWKLGAIHTPGHAPDHLCFALMGSGILFSGDHVMGWNTSVIAPPEGNMGDYMRSLERLLDRKEDKFLPGHGGAIRTPARVVKAFIVHRKWREDAILSCIREGFTNIPDIVAKSYPSLDDELIPAAAMSVLAHVEFLVEKGAVSCSGPVASGAFFSPVV